MELTDQVFDEMLTHDRGVTTMSSTVGSCRTRLLGDIRGWGAHESDGKVT